MNSKVLSVFVIIVAVGTVAGVLIFNNMNSKTLEVVNPIITDNNNNSDNSNSSNDLYSYSLGNNIQPTLTPTPKPTPTPTPTPDPMDKVINLFDAYLKSIFDQSLTPGLAVVIIQDDRIIYLKTMGVKDTSTGAPVTKDTLFEINSMTKAFAGANIAQYVSSGLISWDDPVSKFYNESEFKLYDDYVTDNITIRDLLLMCSGLPKDSGDDLLFFNYTFSDTLYQFRYYQNNTPFRSTHEYNNILYALASYCAARANNQTWDDLIKNDLLLPLGMTTATTNYTDLLNSPDHTKMYAHYLYGDLTEFPIWSEDWDKPSGSIACSISEMANWLKFQIADTGYYNGRQLMSKNALDETRTGQIDVIGKPGFKYAFGWNIGDEYIEHSGASYASYGTMRIYLSNGIGIAIFTNEMQYGGAYTKALSDKFYDLLNGQYNTDPWAVYKPNMTPLTPSPPPLPLSTYSGVYSNNLFGDIKVTQDNNKLICYYGNNSQPYNLDYLDNVDVFVDGLSGKNFIF
ncbi:MAG: beta-lactamase family protein, partial [Methanobacterium sp.]|nr:beta-lactamase family protein [Methanobacterium sp.]